MIPSPIRKVLSIFRKHRVPAILMGGQACVLYGGAEFSRDIDFLVSPSETSLARLRAALDEMKAEPVFLPMLSSEVLRRGHACHFRCRIPAADNLRIDVMSVLRGCDSYSQHSRRSWIVKVPGVGEVSVLSPQDVVRSKKTQRDKDWPMIARLVEADYRSGPRATPGRVRFWLLEARSEPLLIELVQRFPKQAARLTPKRPAIQLAIQDDRRKLRDELLREQEYERSLDRKYWAKLRAELEAWRIERHRSRSI